MPEHTSILLHTHGSSTQHSQAVTFISQAFGVPEEKITSHPDVHFINSDLDPEEYSALSIEQVRAVGAQQTLSPYQGVGESGLAIFVLANIETASLPAQNALLKSLEEPSAHSLFILTSTAPQKVLSTISSRCQLRENESFQEQVIRLQTPAADLSIEELSKKTYSQLIQLAEQKKEKADAIAFTQELVALLHQENAKKPSQKITKHLQSAIQTVDWLQQNANTKLALEQLLFQFKAL